MRIGFFASKGTSKQMKLRPILLRMIKYYSFIYFESYLSKLKWFLFVIARNLKHNL